ncbi:Swi5-domain-containing protein [Lipomyces kononenkoae]|uniref:Swi5-domain-containing protein n=1 Tax=Lipomyces kononenkoae TaxID=34357 RepID=A0ACC3T227_LIPKO
MDGFNSETLETIVQYQELDVAECFSDSSDAPDGDSVLNQGKDAAEDRPTEPAMIDDCLDAHCDIAEESDNEYDCGSEFGSQDSEQSDEAEENNRRHVNDIIFESTISTEVDTVDVERTSSAHRDLPSTPSPQEDINQEPVISIGHGNLDPSNNSSPHAKCVIEPGMSSTTIDVTNRSVDVLVMDTTSCDLSTAINQRQASVIPDQTSASTSNACDSPLPHSSEDRGNGGACLQFEGVTVTNEVDSDTVDTSHNFSQPNQLSFIDTEAATNDQADVVTSPNRSTTTNENKGTVECPTEVSSAVSNIASEPRDPSGAGPDAQQLSNAATRETQIDAEKPKSPLDFITAKETKEAAIKARIQEKQARLADLQKEYDDYIKKLKSPDPSQTIKQHIKLLKEYNEIRDVGLGLIGMIADTRAVRVADVMPEYGVSVGD